MEKKYAKAYTEVLEILKHIPEDEYARIPKSEINFYESNRDKNYKFIYNESVDAKDQNISREASAVIISIYMNYFANEKQKGIIYEILNQNSIRAEEKKKEKYNKDNMFEEKQFNDQTFKNNLPIEIKKENIIKRIINKIKSMFIKQNEA